MRRILGFNWDQQVPNLTPLNPAPATCHKRKRKLRCSFRNAALQKLHCNIGFSAVRKSFGPKAALQQTKNCTATSKKAALQESGAFLPLPAGFKPPRLGTHVSDLLMREKPCFFGVPLPFSAKGGGSGRLCLGARQRGRTATRRSKKSSGKVLGMILGRGFSEGFWEGACHRFCSKEAWWTFGPEKKYLAPPPRQFPNSLQTPSRPLDPSPSWRPPSWDFQLKATPPPPRTPPSPSASRKNKKHPKRPARGSEKRVLRRGSEKRVSRRCLERPLGGYDQDVERGGVEFKL